MKSRGFRSLGYTKEFLGFSWQPGKISQQSPRQCQNRTYALFQYLLYVEDIEDIEEILKA